jgi:hypothetical protein
MNIQRWIQTLIASLVIVFGLLGCSTPKKLGDAELESIGVRNGIKYWEAQQKLAQRGYSCYVNGTKRESFDCTKSEGAFPTCVLRITFVADDMNLVSSLAVSDPACMGTP